jgi:hypothetical protein
MLRFERRRHGVKTNLPAPFDAAWRLASETWTDKDIVVGSTGRSIGQIW